MLVGTESNSLSPVYIPIQHFNGRVPGPTVTVPGIPGDTLAYFQMGRMEWKPLGFIPNQRSGESDWTHRHYSAGLDVLVRPGFDSVLQSTGHCANASSGTRGVGAKCIGIAWVSAVSSAPMNAFFRHWLPLAALLLTAAVARGQGTFAFFNPRARTLIGSVDGAFAGENILAQMLVGIDSSSLSPLGVSKPHLNGLVVGEVLTVPGIPGNATAYMQKVAWNGELWGSFLGSVPADQIGRTDIVPLVLSFSFGPPFAPRFTQGAIVPVPEPAIFGALVFLLRRRRL